MKPDGKRWIGLVLLMAGIGGGYLLFTHRTASPPGEAASVEGASKLLIEKEREEEVKAEGLSPASVAGPNTSPAKPAHPLSTVHQQEEDEELLKNSPSQLADTYLRILQPGQGRLAGESYGVSIVHNAFKQAWGLDARLGLSPKQQAELAIFLLKQDWLSWENVNPEKMHAWAEAHLSRAQQRGLFAYLEERKKGDAMLHGLKRAERRLEHGDRSDAEVFEAETALLKRFLASAAGGADGEVLKRGVPTTEQLREHAALAQMDAVIRPYTLLADRIPFSAEQRVAVFEALIQGEKPPNNPYNYLRATRDRAAVRVRADTIWLKEVLRDEQYETYIEHFLAEIEIVRYQQK